MTTGVTSSPGSCARRCVPMMSPIHLSWRWWPQAATAPRSCTNHDCSAIMDRATSPADLAEWLKDRGIAHVRGAPCHPQTQGKIERWHQTLKNRILLENHYLPDDLK